MLIDGIEVKAGARWLARRLGWSELTFWQKLRWKLAHPFSRYPDLSGNGVYTVEAGTRDRP